jgi:UDP-2,4-diacetamido-2,4,6-trideoxy-beta-L-altropyranose hydrolase
MRCLTLANELRSRGATVTFATVSRAADSARILEDSGYPIHRLDIPANPLDDAAKMVEILGEQPCDWVVVDHYGLDSAWEQAVRSGAKRIFAVDDLANRPHDCNLLLDQNLVRDAEMRYSARIPSACRQLIGPKFAMVRSEFRDFRAQSLARRRSGSAERLLISLGGNDMQGATGKVVAGVARTRRRWQRVDVVVGRDYPLMRALEEAMAALPSQTLLHRQTSEMARLMTHADVAITAGGTTTWEKCTLGLPSLVVTVAENQRPIAAEVHARGGHQWLGDAGTLTAADYACELEQLTAERLREISQNASALCDGRGVERVADAVAELTTSLVR